MGVARESGEIREEADGDQGPEHRDRRAEPIQRRRIMASVRLHVRQGGLELPRDGVVDGLGIRAQRFQSVVKRKAERQSIRLHPRITRGQAVELRTVGTSRRWKSRP